MKTATQPPASIKVGHLDFRVVLTSRAVSEHEGEDAAIDVDVLTIWLADCLPPQLAVEKLIHELLHGCYEVWNIPPRCGEERTVTALAPALTTILRDNPELRRWIDANIETAQ